MGSSMKNKVSTLVATGATLSLLLFGGCRQPSINDYAEKLPDLPSSLAATLDPKTLATRVSSSFPPPQKEPGPFLAPCCGSRDTKSLKVRFSYTKCGPLRDLIMADIGKFVLFNPGQGGGQGGGQTTVKAYRLRELNRKTVIETTVCMTSDGPWDATLIEDRNCNGYTPYQTLLITAFGDPVLFVWSGGTQNHPPGIGLVSCREIALVKFPCGGLSDCQCDSVTCPAEQPCQCTLQW